MFRNTPCRWYQLCNNYNQQPHRTHHCMKYLKHPTDIFCPNMYPQLNRFGSQKKCATNIKTDTNSRLAFIVIFTIFPIFIELAHTLILLPTPSTFAFRVTHHIFKVEVIVLMIFGPACHTLIEFIRSIEHLLHACDNTDIPRIDILIEHKCRPEHIFHICHT